MDSLIVIVSLCLTLSLFFSELCYRLGYPRILGPMITGIFLGFQPFKNFIEPFTEQISFLSELAIVFLLLLAGLEINIRKLQKTSKDAILIAFFSALIPFVLGFSVTKLLYSFGIITTLVDQSNIVAAVVGACLSLTAEGTSLAMLIEMKALNTRVGALVLGSGILDDVFEITFLSALLVFVSNSRSMIEFTILVFMFVVCIILIWKVVPGLIKFIQKEDSRITTVSTIIVITLIIASLSSLFGLSPIIGAFIGGLIIQVSNKDKEDERRDIEELKTLSFSLIVPFFFINIGLNFDVASIFANPLVVFLIVIVGFASKILGSIIVTPITNLTLKQTYLIGWAMNSRGAMELVILELARQNNLITPEIYSAVVVMAILTTLVFPIMFSRIVKKDKNILN
ncbi:MAG: cation:proton antiporter [Candidatus Woesearchaeota archaeon]